MINKFNINHPQIKSRRTTGYQTDFCMSWRRGSARNVKLRLIKPTEMNSLSKYGSQTDGSQKHGSQEDGCQKDGSQAANDDSQTDLGNTMK